MRFIIIKMLVKAYKEYVKNTGRVGVRVDEAFFQGGVQKYEVIKAFGADIFFDDQDTHLEHTSKETPSAKVPYKR